MDNRDKLIEFDGLIDAYQSAQKDGTLDNRADARRALKEAFSAALASDAAGEPVGAADTKPLNGIPATLSHDEGAISRCSYCGRYSLDRETLSDRQPKCDCGEQHGWSGSFLAPGHDAKWSGTAPQPARTPQSTADEIDATFRRNLDLRIVNLRVDDKGEVNWIVVECRGVVSSLEVVRREES